MSARTGDHDGNEHHATQIWHRHNRHRGRHDRRKERSDGHVRRISNRFKAIVERGFSRGDLTVADEVCDDKLIEHQYLARTDLPGPQILKAQIEDARHSIKELKFTIEAVVETRRYGLGARQGNGRRSALRQTSDHRCHGHLSVCRWKACRTLGGAGPVCASSPAWSLTTAAQTNVARGADQRERNPQRA